jgi:hypothetical protein
MRRSLVAGLAFWLCACASPRAPEGEIAESPSVPHSDFPPEFRALWTPGYVETLEYQWSRPGLAGRAVMRTSLDGNFLRMDIRKTAESVAETTSVWMTLAPERGRPAGAIRQVSLAWQAPGVNDYTQLELANTSALVFRLGNPAWQRQYVVSYPPPGFTAEAFLLWARRFAWPRIRIGTRQVVTALTSIDRERRTEPRAASLNLRADGTVTMQYDGTDRYSIARIYRDFPHRIREWTTAEGESAQLVE